MLVLKKEDWIKRSEQIHRDFIRVMSPVYQINPPKEIFVSLRSEGFAGGSFCPLELRININTFPLLVDEPIPERTYFDFELTCAHESAHYLHHIYNQNDFFKKYHSSTIGERIKRLKRQHKMVELFVDLSALLFLYINK